MRLPRILAALACLTILISGDVRSVAAGTPCIEAVFFDLGDTLVENPGNGIFVLRPGAAEAVSDLQALGIRLGIITNVPAGWDLDDLRAILAEPEFLEEFEVVILSSQAPAPKPNPAIYIFAHESLAEPRPPITSAAFVGETLIEIANLEVDPTLGARSVGMVGIHLSDQPPSPLADYTIPTDGLDQVAALVESTCSSTGVNETPSEATTPILAYPNPSDGAVRLEYTLTEPAWVRLEVYDVRGRRVVSLVDQRVGAGRHEAFWNGGDAEGIAVPTGIYYSRLRTGERQRDARIVVVR